MASLKDWCGKLKECGIFEALRRGTPKLPTVNEAKNYIAIRNNELFLWNCCDSTLLRLKLMRLAASEPSGEDAKRPVYQTLLCTNAPKFEVDSISVNQTGSHVMLSGKRGVTVVSIPQYRELLADKTDDRLLCRSVNVAERDFAVSDLQLVDAKWHPGSTTATQIVLLTSDNVMRIFNILTDCEQPEKVYYLGNSSSSDRTTNSDFASPSRIAIVLGDTAVSFDFGSVVLPKDASTENQVGLGGYRTPLWPIYVLQGNGEVYRMLTSLDTRLPNDHRPLIGPLRMHPAAEDNYGTDACSILCLETRPPVLVIGTSEGKLHHCLLLNQPLDEDDIEDDSAGMAGDVLQRMIPLPGLFVFESVELELSLTTVSVETDESINDYFVCPIKLIKDPACVERYHCSHSAGLHSIVLPWARKLQQFYESESESSMSLVNHQQCIVEHLVCTKPLRSSPVSPILGVGIVSDHLLTSKLVCLTSMLECIILPLQSTYRFDPLPLMSEDNSAVQPVPLRQMYHEPFDEYIRKILQQTPPNPFLKSGTSSEPSSQETLQILVRVTQVLREFIQKLELAREEINKRVRILEAVKTQNLRDINKLDEDKETVSQVSKQLMLQYRKACENQQALTERIEFLLRKLQNRVPILSDAERESAKELKAIEAAIGRHSSQIKTIQSKMDFQSSVVNRQPSVRPSLNDTQLKSVHRLLHKEGEDISDLVKQVNNMQANLIS